MATRRNYVKPIVIGLFMTTLTLLFLHALYTLDTSGGLTNAASKNAYPDDELAKRFEASLKWSGYSIHRKMELLLENPVYSELGVSKSNEKKRVTLLLIVSSAPKRYDRRQAIRDTWWSQCLPVGEVVPECIFMTDQPRPSSEHYEKLTEESEKYHDIYFQPLEGGIEFGKRYMYQLIWAMQNYDFDYFIRLDDDYFLCFGKFLRELPMPPAKYFHWGYTHCIENIVRPEESMVMFSRDVIETFLAQGPHLMRCHPWADQMIGFWVSDLGLNNLYRHDLRLHHSPPVIRKAELLSIADVCTKFIGIHGSYANHTRHFWMHRGLPGENVSHGDLIDNSEPCELVHNFNFLIFNYRWQYEPQRCIYRPTWNTQKQKVEGGSYVGREGLQDDD